MDGEGHSIKHFVSITKSRVNNQYFLSDDLHPEYPQDIGISVDNEWVARTWVIYTEIPVSGLPKDSDSDESDNKVLLNGASKAMAGSCNNCDSDDSGGKVPVAGTSESMAIDTRKLFGSKVIHNISQISQEHVIAGYAIVVLLLACAAFNRLVCYLGNIMLQNLGK